MAKWIRNKWNKEVTYEKLEKAHQKSKKGKGYRKEVILFNLKKEEYIAYLVEQLKTRRYKHGGYTVFYVREPKLRKIEKARYLDRVVHCWYVENFLIPYFAISFIYTSYACLKGKGMHKACLAVQKAMQKVKRKYGNYFVLKMDIRKYFANIDKEILLQILLRKIKEEELIWLTKEILYSNGTEKGLPIGNYTSQYFANIYLNELDQHIKHKLKVKWYFRYMDDFLILTRKKEEAIQYLKQIQTFLQDKLNLELNEKTQIFPRKQGVNFCGYQIKENRLKIRPRGKQKLKKKIQYVKQEIKQGNLSSKEAKRYISGHLGYLKIADAKGLLQKLFWIEYDY